MRIPTLIFLLTLSIFSCQRQQESRMLWLPQGRQVALLHGMKAAQVLLQDPHYQYFERITVSDLATQLKQPISAFRSREYALAQYKEALQANIRRFTTEEAELLEGLLQQACRLMYHIDPSLFPRKLALIKVSGRLMGPEVIYTRGQAMIIPQKILKDYSEEKLLSSLVRGLYYLYIREHPQQQKRLYALFNYRPLPHSPDSLIMPEVVRNSINLDPNSGPLAFYLHLPARGASEIRRLYPLSSTAFHNMEIDDPGFPLRSFALYPIDTMANSQWVIETNPEGHSTLFLRDLFYEIQDEYQDEQISLVHPDFSLTDLFIRMVLSKPISEEISPRDAARMDTLINQVEKIIQRSPTPNNQDPS